MAVGTIAGINVSGVRKDGITLSFTKPANTTKFKIDMDPTGTGATLSYTIFNSSATGSKVTFDFPSLKPDTKYYLYVTPYNGTTAGTKKQYTNSGTSNIITTPKAVVTPTPTTIKPPASSSGNTTPTVVKPTSPIGQTLNDATVSSSSGANSQTPTPQISGSVTSAKPSDLNNPARQSLQVTGLNPNQTYTITVYAITTTADGQVIHSENSSALVINTPSSAASGSNFTNSNSGSDTQLSGGSIFAGDFPINTGLFDPITNTTTGSGVILNQYGLSGFASGTNQFYIDSRTGNATFSGTITALGASNSGLVTTDNLQNQGFLTTSTQISGGQIVTGILKNGNFSGPTDGSANSTTGTAFNLDNGTITAKKFRIDTSGNAFFSGTLSADTIVTDGTNTYNLLTNAGLVAQAVLTANSASNAATLAQQSANGKAKIYYSATSPGNTANNVNDIWYQYSGGLVTHQYLGQGGTSWQEVTLSNVVVTSLDAGAITAGTINVSLNLTSATLTGGIINGGRFTTGSTYGHISIGNSYSSWQDTMTFTNYNGDIGATLAPFIDESGVDGLIIHSGPTPVVPSNGNSNGVAMTWVGRDYWNLQYKANVPLISTQFNTLYTYNHFGIAHNGQSLNPSYGSSGNSRMRNIDYGTTQTPTEAPPYVGNGDIYLAY